MSVDSPARTDVVDDAPPAPRRRRGLRARLMEALGPERRAALRAPLVVAGGLIFAVFVIVGVLAPLLAPYDPKAISGVSFAHPSWSHLLGTNGAGQDLFSQLIWGTRFSLTVAVVSATAATLVGVVIGMGGALIGGWVDSAANGLVNVSLAQPPLIAAVLILALAGPSMAVLIIVITLAGWAPVARIVRAEALSLRERGFVHAARGFGGGPFYLLRRHLAPAVGPLIVAGWVDWAAVAVLLESGLAFLGLGDPTRVSWGTMLDGAFRLPVFTLDVVWVWWVLPAGLAITVVVVGFTLLGVGLEPVFNPRTNRGRDA